jgi:O-antigen ligase
MYLGSDFSKSSEVTMKTRSTILDNSSIHFPSVTQWILVIGLCLVDIALGVVVPKLPILELFSAILGTGLFVLFWNRPEWLFVVVVALGAGAFSYDYLPQVVKVGGLGLFPIEVLIGLLLIRMFVKDLSDHNQPLFRSPLTLFFTLFFIMVGVSLLVTLINGEPSLHDALIAVRRYSGYALFPIMFFGLRDLGQVRRFMLGTFAIAITVSSMFILQFLVGPNIHIFLGGLKISTALEEVQGVTRTYAGGILFTFFLLISLNLLFHSNSRHKRLIFGLVTCLTLLHAALSFTRTVWYALVIGILLVWLFGRAKERTGLSLVIAGVATFAISVLLIMNLAVDLKAPGIVDTLLERFISPATGTVATIQTRQIESDFALHAFSRSPLVGIGAGSGFGYTTNWIDFNTNGYVPVQPNSADNGYVTLLMHVGIFGTIPYLLAVGLGTWRAIRSSWQITSPHWQAIQLGIGVGMVTVLISSVTANRFYDPTGIIAIAAMLGVSETLIRLFSGNQAEIPATSRTPGITQPRKDASAIEVYTCQQR